MIEVIRPGNVTKVECENCGAILRYNSKTDVERQDLYGGHITYIVCPECNCKIIFRDTRKK